MIHLSWVHAHRRFTETRPAASRFAADPLQPLQALQFLFSKGSRVTPRSAASYRRYTSRYTRSLHRTRANGSFLVPRNVCNGCNGLGGYRGEVPLPRVIEVLAIIAAGHIAADAHQLGSNAITL